MTHVDWHPYPKEKPTEEKSYLISFYVYTEKRYGIDTEFYDPEHDVWDVYGDGVYTKVYAWAEKPKPYHADQSDLRPEKIKRIIGLLEQIHEELGAYWRHAFSKAPEATTKSGSYASLVHNSLGGILFAIGCLSEAIGKWEK